MKNQQTNNKKRHIIITTTAVALLGAGGLWAATQAHSDQQSTHTSSYQKKMQKPKASKGSQAKKEKGKNTVNDIIDQALGDSSTSTSSEDHAFKSATNSVLDSNPIAAIAKTLDTPAAKASLAAATAAVEPPKTLNDNSDDTASVKPLTNDTTDTSQTDQGKTNDGGKTPTPVNPIEPVDPDKPVNPITPVNPDNPDNPGNPVDPVNPVNPVQPEQNTAPVLNVPEDQTVSLSHNGTFDVLNGVTTSDKEDGDLTKAIKVTGNVDLSKEGTYTLTYSVTDSAGQTTSAKRVITVANDLPVISADDQTIEVGTSFDPLTNVTASDVQDGDLTRDVKVTGNVDTTKLGTYQLTYSVSDHDGGQTTKTINITVYAKDASFSGLDALTVQQGSTPDLRKGVSVSDPYSATPSDFTVTTCDTKTPGQKSVTYSYVDKWSHVTTKDRVINVIAEKPVFKGLQDQTIKQGDPFDPMTGVSATSTNGPVTISYVGEVNTQKAGRYTLTYTATDQNGQQAEQTIVVTVE